MAREGNFFVSSLLFIVEKRKKKIGLASPIAVHVPFISQFKEMRHSPASPEMSRSY